MAKKIPKIGPAGPPPRPASLAGLGIYLRQEREQLGLTLDNLMAKTQISKPYLSNIETGRAPGPPSEDKLRRIAKALKLPAKELLAAADWLRTPESVRQLLTHASPNRRADGTLNLDAALPAASRKSAEHAPEIVRKGQEVTPVALKPIPLINRVTAGSASEFTDLDYPRGIADQYIPAPDLPETPVSSAFALKILGDSMAPDYVEGQIIIVAPSPPSAEPKDGDDCVVRLDEKENFATTFKRIYFIMNQGEPAAVRLVPLNPAHAERVVAIANISGIYPILYRLVPPKQGGG